MIDEARHKYIEYHMEDGVIRSSKEVYWKDIGWDKVVKIVIKLKNNCYEINNSNPCFKFFLNFRMANYIPICINGKLMGHEIIEDWVIGWSDGVFAYLKSYNFKTCLKTKEWVQPISELLPHVHELVSHKILQPKLINNNG